MAEHPQQLIAEGRMLGHRDRVRQIARGPARLTFTAKQRAAIESWMGTAAPLKDDFFRSVERRYMDPDDVLSGKGRRRTAVVLPLWA